ncbi:MAG: MFS transporter [Hyphomicrobiales bacterium]|nr:MFS transporter [Hyphomicrobiales bacterium]
MLDVLGWLADRIGRGRALCSPILAYSIFTACCGLAPTVAVFAVFRFLAGFGIGGEWAAGTPLLHESVPESMRARLAGWLHSATPIGLTLATLVALGTLPILGWRGLFLIGVLPFGARALSSCHLARAQSPADEAAHLRALHGRAGTLHRLGRLDDGMRHLRPVVLDLLDSHPRHHQARRGGRLGRLRAEHGGGERGHHQSRHSRGLPSHALDDRSCGRPQADRLCVLYRCARDQPSLLSRHRAGAERHRPAFRLSARARLFHQQGLRALHDLVA